MMPTDTPPRSTPGPWYIVLRSGPGDIVAEICYGDVGECIAEGVYTMADAWLIAAAPALFKALNHLQSKPNDPQSHHDAIAALKLVNPSLFP